MRLSSRDYVHGNFASDWFDTHAPHDSAVAVAANREVVKAFLQSVPLELDQGHPQRTEPQKHLVAYGVPLSRAYQELLTQFRMTRPIDSQRFTGLLLQVSAYFRGSSRRDLYRIPNEPGAAAQT